MADKLSLAEQEGTWQLVGADHGAVALANEYLCYLADRNYSSQSVRSYGFSLLAFCRWLIAEQIELEEVSTDVLLRFLAACRQAKVPGRPGPNVVRMDGRRADGYAPATTNLRLAAISGLFGFRCMRDPDAKNPVPRGRKHDGSRQASAWACSLMSPAVPATVRLCACASRSACPSPWTTARSSLW